MGKSTKFRWVRFFANKRWMIQLVIGAAIYYAIGAFNISIWWVIGFGSAIGIIWGKVFCRWMCPMGVLMELFLKINPSESFRNAYQYHKLGCPIAWISGLLNKTSLFQIKIDRTSCVNCGLCDKACYISTLESDKFSLHQPNKKSPALSYTCSKCLKCVSVCPRSSLSYKPDLRSTLKMLSDN